MTHRFIPETHDAVLTELNEKWRRTDQEIADAMGFSRDTITGHRNRLGLPRYIRPKAPGNREADSRAPKEKPNPLKVASVWLGKRLVEKPSGYWLDGVPVNLDAIMQATNQILKAEGVEQVTYCERWRVG
jgi:hypothetical protein